MKIRVIESITKYSKLNRILESVNMSLFEMLDLAEPIRKAIEDSGLSVPSEFKSVNKIDLIGDDHNNLMVKLDNKTEIKIGRLLTQFFPELKANEITKIVSKVKSNLYKLNKNYEFKLYKNDIGKWYKKCGIDSCMTKEDTSHLPYTYDIMNTNEEHNVSILVLYEDNKIIGRALVWYNVDGAKKGIFMDRVYPADEKFSYIHAMFHEYAKSKNWTYRENGEFKIYNGEQVLTIDLSKVWNDIDVMPYVDTFTYGNLEGVISSKKLPNNIYKFNKIRGTQIKLEGEIVHTLINADHINPDDVDMYFNIDNESSIVFTDDNKFEFKLSEFIKYIISDSDDYDLYKLEELYNVVTEFFIDEFSAKEIVMSEDYYFDLLKEYIENNTDIDLSNKDEDEIYDLYLTATTDIYMEYFKKKQDALFYNFRKHLPDDYKVILNNRDEIVCQVSFKKDSFFYDYIMEVLSEFSEIPISIGMGSFDNNLEKTLIDSFDYIMDMDEKLISFENYLQNLDIEDYL